MDKTPPGTVKVGYVDYEVSAWDSKEAHIANRYGETDRLKRKIRIDTEHSPHQIGETLLHEILHCIFEMWDLPHMSRDEEEKIVRRLSNGLATVWRDNPDVFAWIDACLTARSGGAGLPK